jgi:hypothetical protein
MSELSLLFIEDDDLVVDLFERALDDWHAKHAKEGRRFRLDLKGTAEEAQDALLRTRYDAALVDLRLPAGGKAAKDPIGNNITKYIISDLGIPVAIMTGNPGEVDDALEADNSPVRIFFKNDKTAYDDAMNWIGSWWEMMEYVSAARQQLRKASSDIFMKRLWPAWGQFSNILKNGGSGDELRMIVARQYVTHAAELFGLDGPGGTKWHPFECYVIPSLSERVATGDIFKRKDGHWVTLSPACDLAMGNIKNVVMAKCIDAPADWEERLKIWKEAPEGEKKEKASRYFLDRVNQNIGTAKHFLPPLPGTGQPKLVDFQQLQTVPLDELRADLKSRIGSIAQPFLSNLTQRFGANISRVGQPNIEITHFLD